MEDKLYKDSGTWQTGECFRGSVFRGRPDYYLQNKWQISASWNTCYKTWRRVTGRPPGVLEASHATLRVSLIWHINHRRLPALSDGTEEGICSKSWLFSNNSLSFQLPSSLFHKYCSEIYMWSLDLYGIQNKCNSHVPLRPSSHIYFSRIIFYYPHFLPAHMNTSHSHHFTHAQVLWD